jgi:hypothetical protein
MGAVQTGESHPNLENIPHPSSPVPSSSNVGQSADQQLQSAKTTAEVKGTRNLHEVKNATEGKASGDMHDGSTDSVVAG